jgi:hypothetical protein
VLVVENTFADGIRVVSTNVGDVGVSAFTERGVAVTDIGGVRSGREEGERERGKHVCWFSVTARTGKEMKDGQRSKRVTVLFK